MSQTKTCPSCSGQAPLSAARCKECFHEFPAQRKRNYGPLMLLGVLGVLTLGASLVFFLLALQPTDQRILVDEETKSVVITTQYRSGPSAERIPFGDIVKIEHVANGGKYEVVAITTDAERRTLMSSAKEPLYSQAEQYASVMGKPFERVGDDEALRAKHDPMNP